MGAVDGARMAMAIDLRPFVIFLQCVYENAFIFMTHPRSPPTRAPLVRQIFMKLISR